MGLGRSWQMEEAAVATGRRSGGSSPFGEGSSSSKLLVTKPTSRRRRGPVEQQYVAIDLHRRRSLIVRQNEKGEELGVVRINNDPVALSLAMAEAGPNPEVAIEATYGWYWAVDVLQADGANVHLVHPNGLKWDDRRVKNDYLDCRELLKRLRLGELPEAWIAPVGLRGLREMVRQRAKLVALRSGLKVQVHAVLAKHGLQPPGGDLWGVTGTEWLEAVDLGAPYAFKVNGLLELIDHLDAQVDDYQHVIHDWLADDVGYRAIQALDGIGPTIAAILVAEIGDITRFSSPGQLCSWAGLTPKLIFPPPTGHGSCYGVNRLVRFLCTRLGDGCRIWPDAGQGRGR